MSKIALKANDSGTGTFEIQVPATNTNRVLELPDEAGKVLTDVSDIAANKLTGDIAADRMKDGFNASGSAPIYACRAWVNFNGFGTPSIRASGNVSSVTKSSTGRYLVNFTTAMPDTNYSVVGLGGGSGSITGDDSPMTLGGVPSSTSQTPTVRVRNYRNEIVFDSEYCSITVFR